MAVVRNKVSMLRCASILLPSYCETRIISTCFQINILQQRHFNRTLTPINLNKNGKRLNYLAISLRVL